MRVGIDAHAIGSEQSGNETYYEQLLKHLAVTPTNGNRYVIYYTNPAGAGRIPTSEKFHLKRLWPATPFWRVPVGFPLEFRREKLDVFHAQYIIPPFCNCKTVTTIPDIAYEHYPEFFTRFYGCAPRRSLGDLRSEQTTSSPYLTTRRMTSQGHTISTRIGSR